MKVNKPVMVFIFPNCIGGVASYNRNLINHTSLKNRCHTRVVLLDSLEDKRARFTDLIKADEIIRFSYSSRENQFSVCKRLHTIIGDEGGCIIADNGLTLNAISQFGSAKRLIYLVHDYFYVNWALHYHRIIDVVITHASFFADVLLAAAVNEYQDKIFYIPYGVELPPEGFMKPVNPILKLVFLGRLIEEKGVLLLKDIDQQIQMKGIKANWTIVGRGPLLERLIDQWKSAANINFIQAKDTQAVYDVLQEQDILVFPSWFEGTPVAIMEALSRGVIPIVSDLPGGTRDMVTENLGIRCTVKDPLSYANAIEQLWRNPPKIREMQNAGIQSARTNYDINKAADAYFSFFLQQAEKVRKDHIKNLVQFSRLDKEYFPNWMVYHLRKMRQYLSLGRLLKKTKIV
jgi:glycosyltransferase involved in cell wall biosynthesis